MTSITGHSQDVECAICGVKSTVTGIDEHHVIHRSMGGTDGVTLMLCRGCHTKMHSEKNGGDRYTLSVTQDRVYLLDGDKIIVDRPRRLPADFTEGKFIDELENAPAALRERATKFRFLSDDGLKAAGAALARISDVSWELRARLFQQALLRSPWGSKRAILLDVAKEFGIERAQAYREAQLIGWVEERPDVSSVLDDLPPTEVLLKIKDAPDPVAAAELWVDRKAADPTYTRKQFAAEVAGVEREWCDHRECPTCGAGLPHYRKAE